MYERTRCYLSLLLLLELLPVDPARVRLPLESLESFRVRVPTCSFELALLTVLWWDGRWTEAQRDRKAWEMGYKTTWRCFSKNALRLNFTWEIASESPYREDVFISWFSSDLPHTLLKNVTLYNICQGEFATKLQRNEETWMFVPGDHNYNISPDVCKSAYWWRRLPAYSQQRKGSISNSMASRPSHLIHPMGEKSIQILKLAGGRYPFWRASVCLFSKEQNGLERHVREKLLFAVLSREES